MCEAGGYYWIASYGSGIIQLDRKFRVVRVINSGNGLTNDGVYQLYPVSGDRLLVTTNNGISLLDIHESGGKNYFALDGLHSNGFEEVCGAASGGLIYAGGLNGFTVIDPTKFDTNGTPPRFFFTAIRTQLRGRLLDTSNLSMVALTVPDNWLQTSISFSGLSYSRPESVRYQYRILQQDTSWISLGTRASLDLLGLPPGAYTLEVRAANEDGYWSAPSRMLLHFQPKWYETWWFKIGILLLAAALFYAFYRLRIGELRKQQAIRSGIASDLHDDIGSLLNSVKVFSHLARRSPDHEDHFQNIDESLTQATVGLRDMIWVLDNSEDTVYELIERIKKFALPVTAAYGIRLKFSLQLPETDIAISKTEKRNLLLMAKEAINNSIKYSECGVITVECSRSGRGVALRISDDGKGFDMDIPSSGNGLRNLKDRAVQIKYRCRIVSAPGAGTKIEIQKA
jgi:signal transduction histidine kinase